MDVKYIGRDRPFNDHFNSSNLDKTKEIEIIARRYGFEPLYDQRVTSANHSNVFFNTKSIDSNSNIYDDYNPTFCYLCSVNAHEHERTKPRDESKRRKLIPYKNPKARLSSSLNRISQNSSSDLDSYRFIVRTGTKTNSGTRAQVFLYIYGTEKNWTSIHLQNSSTTNDGFPSGSTRTFCLKGPNIGQLHHLNVNLIGSRSNKEWFLKEIEITNLKNSMTWLCEFNCWLPKTDEQENKQIKQTEFSLSIYILQIRTGEKPFAGTDSNVQITVHGSANRTRRLALTSNRANLFEQNQIDTFAIVGKDLGDLLEITVESDKSQIAADWDIKEMTMWKIIPNDDHKQTYVYFPFNTWLGKKVSTLKSKRDVYQLTDYQLKGPICYQVSVKTGKLMNAGTDANVFLIIYGKSGRTIIHQLNNHLKNDFERNTISEFTIMDIDVGEIDRIKIWHDNSGPGSAWFLDSVVIHKKYSTCYTISNIYIQRLDEISKALHRYIGDQTKKDFTVHEDKYQSASQRSLKSDNGSNEYLGNSRGILRSPTMYDRASLQKKVRWDEQSIGSQEDLLSIDSRRSKSMQNLNEQKRKKVDSIHHESGHLDHQAYWISSHSYTDHQWKIQSIEEINSFDFDQTTRSLLLSDRLTLNNKIKTSVRDNEDEIYEFQANRWLAKDKEDGKLEVYLPAKLIHKSTHMDPKTKQLSSSKIHSQTQLKKHDEEESKGLRPIEKSPRSLTSTNLRPHISDVSKQRNMNPLFRQNTTLKQEEKLSKSNPSIDQYSSSTPITQRLKSPQNINDLSSPLDSERELLARLIGEPSPHPRLTGTSSLSTNQRLQSPKNINEHESSIHSRSTVAPLSSSSSPHLKSPRNINERKPLTKISDQSSYYSRSTPTQLSSIDQYSKSPRNSNDLVNSSLNNPRDSLSRIPRESIDQSRPPIPSISSSNQRLKSPHIPNELINSSTSEQELLARFTNDSSYRLPSPMTSLNQRPKLTRSSNKSFNPSMDEQNVLTESHHYPQSVKSLTKTSIESSLKSKPVMQSSPKLTSQKSSYNQIYNSAYGTAPSDDF